jgi:hypothetical protein
MCLSSRKNLCIHETVSQFDDREKVDSECRARTASWVREKRQTASEQMQWQSDAKIMQQSTLPDIEDIANCNYYENFIAE